MLRCSIFYSLLCRNSKLLHRLRSSRRYRDFKQWRPKTASSVESLVLTKQRCAPIREKIFTQKASFSNDSNSKSAYSFSQANRLVQDERTGLFDCPEFSTVEDFPSETRKCIKTSKKLVELITKKADDPDVTIIDSMDQLSDELCRVADLAECIRQVHPNPDMASAAQFACLELNSYVEELNTNTGLYTALRRLMDSNVYSALDKVTKRTADVFMHDFEISGIHLKEDIRKKVVELNARLLEIGYKFSLNASEPTLIKKDNSVPDFGEYFNEEHNHLCMDHVPYNSLNPDLRKSGYMLYYSQNFEKMKVFEEMISMRQKLAHLVGYSSFSHRVLRMSMAESPEKVTDFLENLSSKILPLAREDVEVMTHIKNRYRGIFRKEEAVGHWDIPLLISKIQECHLPPDMNLVRNWFPLDACIDGLGNLFRSLFGVRLEVMPVKQGELWHPSVLKFGFFDESGELLGLTYGDFFHRENKFASDSHITIRGGREIFENERFMEYQLPIITLCCNFEQPSKTEHYVLSLHSVETLFHEMGHALHSMLGRAKYQNVTGTRCSTDFAEVPSILMEFFLNDDRVLSSFARHYKTGKELPLPLMRGFQLSGHFLAAFDMQIQISNAIMDQRFHSDISFPSDATGWSAEIYKETTEKYSPFSSIPNTAYYLRFPHLCSYGSRYYSYLWSRAVASLIWKSNFRDDPFSRVSGKKYRTMLSYGGGINPTVLVRNMLGFEPTIEELVNALYSDVLKQREHVKEIFEASK